MSIAAGARPVATTSDLVRFLLARVDDDDAELRRLARKHADSDPPGSVRSLERLRAESTARRQVIGTVQQLLVLRDQPFEKAIRDNATHLLRVLAAPYAAHLGYREEWRPSAPRCER